MKFRLTYEEFDKNSLSSDIDRYITLPYYLHNIPITRNKPPVSTLYEIEINMDATQILDIASRHNIYVPNAISLPLSTRFYEIVLAYNAEHELKISGTRIMLRKIEFISL